MKKIIVVFLTLCMMLSAVGCGSTAGTPSTTEPDASGKPVESTEPAEETKGFYDSKLITWIVEWSAGGATDLITRALTSRLEEKLNCTINVLNTNGGGGLVGFQTLSAAPADGFTYGALTATMLLYKPTGVADVEYTVCEPMGLLCYAPICIYVPADSPFETLADLVAYAQAHPGELTGANTGLGAINYALTESLAQKADFTYTAVPYNSGTEALTACAGGHVDFSTNSLLEGIAMLDSGDVRALTLFGDEGSAKYPDIPTTTACGYPGLVSAWTGFCAPVGIPEEAKAEMLAAAEEIVNSDDWAEVMDGFGNNAAFLGGADYEEMLSGLSADFNELLGE